MAGTVQKQSNLMPRVLRLGEQTARRVTARWAQDDWGL